MTKAMNEKIKRKDYELKTLKQEIQEKTSELSKLSGNKQHHAYKPTLNL
jgi:hypothetical protein